MRFRKKHLKWLSAILAVLAAPVILAVLSYWLAPFLVDDPMPVIEQQKPVILCYDHNQNLIFAHRSDGQWRLPVPLEQISPHFLHAIIGVEDKNFYHHHGIDFTAILRACLLNFQNGRVISGASTITMQLAALPAQGAKKHLPQKLRQAAQALKLEKLYSKDRILYEYVNRVPFGGSYYGIEAASLFYFGKHASELELAEAALLAGIPQRPQAFRPDRHLKRSLERRDLVASILLHTRTISRKEYDAILLEREPFLRDFSSPFALRLDDDFSNRLFLQKAIADAKGAEKIHTTCNPAYHALILQKLRQAVKELPDVRDAAAVLLDSRTSEILSMVGTLDFLSPEAGQVNAAMAQRSAGSTLKPFIYAEAIQGGIITEDTRILDAPLRYGDYTPANYDGTFLGPVPAKDALARSLNTPAIRLLAELGLERTLEVFQNLQLITEANKQSIAKEKGLTLALGTAGHSLLQITNAYAALANGGKFLPATALQGTQRKAKRVFSEATAAMVSDMLRNSTYSSIPAAWKTGTSNGLHDAWCIIYTPDFTLGVWFGNKTGAASSYLVGAKTAAPVAGCILDALYVAHCPPAWPTEDKWLVRVPLCKVSGLPPSAECKELISGLVLREYQPLACTDCTQSQVQTIAIQTPKSANYLATSDEGVKLFFQTDFPTAEWFIDNKYAGQIAPDQPQFFLPGQHTLLAIDPEGKALSATITFSVTQDK